MKYRVRNWTHFQHYHDRNPPWIKLHFELLSSADWVTLADASRVLAVACMLVASRNNGEIDGSAAGLAYLHRVAYLSQTPNLKPLIECGFLEPASDMLADASGCYQNARPETETETEKEKKSAPDGEWFAGVPEQVVHDFKALRRKLRAEITKTAMDGIRREASKAGISLTEALTTCCERGWRGFKAEWVQGGNPSAPVTCGTPRRRRELGT